MAQKLGPLEVECDAPQYAVVQACTMIGLEAPEDVRWVRVRHMGQVQQGGEPGVRNLWRFVQTLVQPPQRDPSNCTCGAKLPVLEGYAFTFSTGTEIRYLLGQCRRCKTVYWEEHNDTN